MTLTQKLFTGLLLVVFISPIFAKDRALLVGIDEYWYTSPLRGSKKDVKNMKQFIQDVWDYKPNEIRTLTDKKATRKGILDAFDNWLIKDSRPGDRVLFYYSGHGYYVEDDDGDESDGYDETLCPVDTEISGETMIRDDEIEARLRQLNDRKVTVIIDACHSGTVTRSLGLRRPDPSIKTPVFSYPKVSLTRSLSKPEGFVSSEKNVVAYSAVAPNQVALVDTENPYQGVFTTRFIQGVQEKRADSNHDGQVSHAELLEYIRRESQAYCDRKPRQCTARALSPQLEAKPEMLAADVRTGKAPRTNNTAGQVSSLLQHDNKANLRVKILPRRLFKKGEKMQIRIDSNHKGYFLLFDINSEGKLTRLFPNQYSKQGDKHGYVKAKQTIVIPDHHYGFDFIANEPFGKGLLVALVVEDELSRVQKLIPTAFKQIQAREAQVVLQKLRQQLNKTLPQRNKNGEVVNRPVRWSIAVVEYEIIPNTRGLRGSLQNSSYTLLAKREIGVP